MAIWDRFKYKTFSHGIHLPDKKEHTKDKAIRRLPFAPELIIPLSQHFGKPAIAIVSPGQEVVRGEVIARSDGFMSVPIHAPASGVIKAIKLHPTARGPKTKAIILETWPGANQRTASFDHVYAASLTHESQPQVCQTRNDPEASAPQKALPDICEPSPAEHPSRASLASPSQNR